MSDRPDAPKIVSDIDDLLRGIWVQLNDPEGLSVTILKLAVLNGGLGNWLAEAQDNERRAEQRYKYQLNVLKLQTMATELDDRGKSVSATFAESKALIELADENTEWLDAQHQVSVLRIKRQSVDQSVDAARSRLAIIRNDIRQQ